MSTKKSHYHHGNLKEAVIEAAHRLIGSEGVNAITLRRLASEVGVSQNAPYTHFKNKSALLAELCTDGFRGLTDSMKSFSASTSSPSAYFRAIGKGYVTYAITNPELFHLMFNFCLKEKSNYPKLEAVSMASFQVVQQAVVNIQLEASRDDEGALAAAISAWALVHGLSVLLIENNLSEQPELMSLSYEQLIDKSADIFSQGLAISMERDQY